VSRVDVLVLIVSMAAVTWIARASFIMLGERVAFPPVLRRALTYVPPAVLAAIVAPALAQPSGTLLGPIDARLVAGAVAGMVAWRTHNIVATFVTGMVVLWAVGWLVG
jgi:branched-subunit amino acid transport protein